MAPLSLKIILDEGAVTRKVKFDNKMTVHAAHAIVKDKVIVADPTKEYALFLRSADNDLSGIWLEPQRTLDYYMLRDGDSLDYICKVRNLRIKLLDGSVKTMQVDEGKSVSELMMSICARIGIINYDEYGLCPEEEEKLDETKEQSHTGTLTIKRGIKRERERDVALEQLSKKLNTDDNVIWLDQHRTLRELGVDSTATVILKRRLFFSDRNVDARDPIQLNLLYVQTRDAILNGRHLVTEEQAADCKVRWINIRDVHRRILRKNLGQSTRLSKHYKYENELGFMRAFYKDVAPPQVSCEDEDKTNDWTVNLVCEDNIVPDGSCSDDSDKPIKKIKTKRRKTKKIKDVSYDEEEKQASSTFNESQHSQPSTVDFDVSDPVDAFLLSVGATLKTFSPYHLNVAKSKIFAVVQEHDLQQIVQKERQEQHDVKTCTTNEMYIV